MKKDSGKRSAAAGRTDGRREGFMRGWRDGACQAAAAASAAYASRPPRRSLRILYIPQGFDAIDTGVAAALRECASEVKVGKAETMREMASAIRPDLMLVLNGLHVFPEDHLEQVDAVRAMGIKTAIWFADDPYVSEYTASIAPRYDVVFTHELSTVPFYRNLGCAEVHYLPFAAYSELFKPLAVSSEYWSDVCFIGQGFWNRIRMFDEIAGELSGRRVFIAGGLWDRLNHYSRLAPSIRSGWLPVEDSVRYYNGAKIVINLHRTVEPGKDNRNTYNLPGRSINPRTFEISACGAFQLTDKREDLSSYYKPGLEIETFSSPAELTAKIRNYLKHEEERSQIAVRGLLRTLRDHNYTNRVDRLLSFI
ncbi:spore maturation protein [Paenibacillus sambharensis]|uniref:Spore maturation protein n=1 Tax=Paenibacillus sambharensis TaxID=1803190 RepID=A0A2W1L8I2_9BACL|nr:glycosyltransferase [Paenibacillus sambharensis]PZD95139.1 spore maturation protein [Paenibacillus sambharensis]